jgi:hypothetical protein
VAEANSRFLHCARRGELRSNDTEKQKKKNKSKSKSKSKSNGNRRFLDSLRSLGMTARNKSECGGEEAAEQQRGDG